MTYLNALNAELRRAGVPALRRRRIVTEFADHLHENPSAELGAPRELARQFADDLATRLARRAAVVAFTGLALTGIAFAAVLLIGTRIVLLPLGTHQVGFVTRRATIVAPLYIFAAQVALAAGVLALLRAWRLRRVPVITAADAAILHRRVGVALLAGILTAASAPVSGIFAARGEVYVRPADVSGICVLILLAMLWFPLRGLTLRPSRAGAAGDLRFDLGSRDSRITPLRIALALSAVILIVVAAAGLVADDPYDGIARGLLDGAACLIGFVVLGRYLGLRTPVETPAKTQPETQPGIAQ
jgi:hypothetical protein